MTRRKDDRCSIEGAIARFQRARKPEEKDVRRAAILRAARELAREVGPIELGLNELGRRSGVSKPNIYRYFESREEILVRLLIAELDDAAAHAEATLPALADDAVAAAIVEIFLSRPLLCQLLGMVASILEHNLGVDALRVAKQEMHVLAGRVAMAVGEALPWLSPADAVWAMQTIALYVAGMWPAAHPSSAAAEVMARPEFASFRVDAARDLRRFVDVVLAGLRAVSR
jgi:AcrR family transcriptional regulator